MATSYTHISGSGDRSRWITITKSSGVGEAGTRYTLVDGAQNNAYYFGGGGWAVANEWLQYDFQEPIIIDEAKWYQDTADSHGSWKWQGSADASAWTDIGTSFTLGGATTQTQTQLNGNTTAYRYYRMLGVSGTASGGPYLREIEFKAETDTSQTTSYFYVLGITGRTGNTIVGTESASLFSTGDNQDLADGSYASVAGFASVTASGHWMKYDFTSAFNITEALWLQSTNNTHGNWKWQGSNDNSAWTDIGTDFSLGGGTVHEVNGYLTRHTQLNANTSSYRYYRLLGVSGSVAPAPFLVEMFFKLVGAPASPAATPRRVIY